MMVAKGQCKAATESYQE